MFIDSRILWLLFFIGIFCVIGLTPYHLGLPYEWWKFLHILNASLYSGIVVISSIFEWKVIRSNDPHLLRMYGQIILKLDKFLITLSVSFLLISALALLNYQGFELWHMEVWPKWMTYSFIILSLTGILWGGFDVLSQNKTNHLVDLELSQPVHSESRQITFSQDLDRLLKVRLRINLISVATIPILYYLMIFKPL